MTTLNYLFLGLAVSVALVGWGFSAELRRAGGRAWRRL
jgi:hypothetical protein